MLETIVGYENRFIMNTQEKKNPFIVDLLGNWRNLMKQSMTLSYLVCIYFIFQNLSLKMLKKSIVFVSYEQKL